MKNKDSILVDYTDSPGQLLLDTYLNYKIIKKTHETHRGYEVVYVNDVQIFNAKK